MEHLPSVKCLLVALFFLETVETAFSQTDYWHQLNGPFHVEVGAILTTARGYSLAGSWRGIFRSTDHAANWIEVQTTRSYYVISFAQNSLGHIFAGTFGQGILLSKDDGVTWSLTDTTKVHYVYSLAISSNDHVFAGTLDGVFRSTNGGQSWTQLGLKNYLTISLAVDSSDRIFAAAYDVGVFRSTNNGESWTQISTGLGTPRWFNDVAINSAGRVFLATSAGVFKLSDNDTSWIRTTLTSGAVEVLSINQDNAIYTAVWGTALDQPFHILRSSNNGETWERLGWGPYYQQGLCIEFDSSGQVLVGSPGGGVYRSTDGGMHWIGTVSSCSLSKRFPFSSAVGSIAFGKDSLIYVCTVDAGVFRSADNGSTWMPLGLAEAGLPGVGSIATDNTGTLLAGSGTGVVYRLRSDGLGWDRVLRTVNVMGAGLSSDSSGAFFVRTGDGYVYRSTDQGTTWTRGRISSRRSVTGLTVTADTVFVVDNGARIYKSTDQGLTWTLLSSSWNTILLYAFCLTSNSSGHLFTGGYGDNKVSRSTDGGMTWIAAALPVLDENVQVTNICVNSLGFLYASVSTKGLGAYHGSEGVYQSTDNGDTWAPLKTGLAGSDFRPLAIDKRGYVFVGSEYGVFRSTQPTTSIRESSNSMPTSHSLFQNYPNPFNPSTTIEFSLPRAEDVTLKIYNLLGEEVERLVSERLQAGTHSLQWNAVGMSSGVYFYRLQAGEFTETKKLILLR